MEEHLGAVQGYFKKLLIRVKNKFAICEFANENKSKKCRGKTRFEITEKMVLLRQQK